jgi:arabinofuranosyltransferase
MLVQTLANFYKAHFKLILFAVFLGLALLAWSNRFIQDDAFISFRYADNLVHGRGLVWNEGERVEGYTNFLWTVIISIPLLLKVDALKFLSGLGLVLFELSLYFTYRLAADLFQSKHLALLTVFLLGTNFTFSSYATGGMETQLQTCLLIASLWLLFRSVPPALGFLRSVPPASAVLKSVPPASAGGSLPNAPNVHPPTSKRSGAGLLILSVTLSLAVLTRLDSLIIVSIVFAVALLNIFRSGKSILKSVPPALAGGLSPNDLITNKSLAAIFLLVPFAVIVGSWLTWKLSFYGSVLPNTFYVKVASLNSLKRGLLYVYLFFHSYWLIPFPFLFVLFSRRLWHRRNRDWLVLAIIILLWLSYVVWVGGDFMEFRFLVPVLPLLFLGIVWLTFVHVRRLKLQLALILLVFCGSLHHALTFSTPALRYYDVESTQGLSDLLYRDRTDWVGIGNVLGEAFKHNPNITIGTTAAGAIPYYSGLKTIDILGLNDRWVARHGEIVASKPGHQRRATLDYLIERQVNLLIGHPQMVPIESELSGAPLNDYYFYVKITKSDRLPANSKIIEIPINPGYKLRVLYLVANPEVDDVIRKRGWVTYAFVPE